MLEVNKSFPRSAAESELSNSSLQDIATFLQNVIRRNHLIFICVAAFCCFVGTFYLYVSKPSYTATASMIVDAKRTQLFEQSGSGADDTVDAGTIQTQVELIKSRNVSLAVINSLHLDSDPEFVAPDPGFLRTILGYLTRPFSKSGEEVSPADLQQQALGVFAGDETVTRLGQSYVMEVGFKSLDAEKAARIANAIVEAYIRDQLDSRNQATLHSSKWLEQRIKEMRSQTISADQAVVDFRKANNLVGSGGKLINEQQLGEVNSQLVLAEAATAEARAKLDRLSEVLKRPLPSVSVTDALTNPVIISLRTKYFELAGRQAIMSAKYGANHQITISLRNEMAELRNNIRDEMHNVAAGDESDYRIALARERSLRQSLSDSVSNSQRTSQAQVTLRNLESTSTSYKSMYDILLQRYMQAVQQQSFTVSESRLIGPASTPGAPSHPRKAVVFAETIVAAVLLSFSIALAKEHLNQVFRTSQQIGDHLGVKCIAIVPIVRRNVLPIYRARQAPLLSREFYVERNIMRYVSDAPLSRFAEALRSAKISVDLSLPVRKAKVIGVTSSLSGEGKSTIAVNLAQTIAQSSNRVLLVDGDMRNSTLTQELTLGPAVGLIEASRAIEKCSDYFWHDPSSGLFFLPAGNCVEQTSYFNEVLGSNNMASLFEMLRNLFDYIVVDCAPLLPIADTRMTVRFIDAYVYIVAWGQTKIGLVDHALREAPEVFDHVVGVVMNKVNIDALGRYETHRSAAYHQTFFAKYGS